MKKLLTALVFGLLTLSPCYAQNGARSMTFKAVGTTTPINLLNTAIAWHELTWNVVGTVSACTVALDSSADGVTWSSGGVITGQDCSSNNFSTVENVVANYVRINVTALTLTAGSSVTVTWDGWIIEPGGGGEVSCAISGGVAFETASNVVGCDSNLIWDNTNKILGAANTYIGPFVDEPSAPLQASAVIISDDSAPQPTDIALALYSALVNGGGGQALDVNAETSGSNNLSETNAIAVTSDHESTGTLDRMVGIEVENSNEVGAGAIAQSTNLLIDSPNAFSTTPITSQYGIDIEDQGASVPGPTNPTAGVALEVESQTGKAIVVEGGESDFDTMKMNKCSAGCILVASLTTTAATSDNVAVTGMTSSGHCSLTPTNATAIGLTTLPYISAKTTNQITVTHPITANATFDILCTPY